MKHILTNQILYVLLLLLNCACCFDDLYYSTDTNCHIRLKVDWSKVDTRLNGASVYVYHYDGLLFQALPPSADPYKLDLALPKGKYHLVVHNNTPYELPNLNFTGKEHGETFRVSPVENRDTKYNLRSVLEPDVIGLAHLYDLEVTETMIDYFPYQPGSWENRNYKEFDLIAEPGLVEMEVVVHVKRLNSAAGAPPSELQNMAGGLMMLTKDRFDEGVDQHFILNERKFDAGSTTDGTISKTIKSFGLRENQQETYKLLMNFKLVNGDLHPILIDVTNKIEQLADLKYRIQVSCSLPDVPGVGEGDSGFDPDVEDWDNIEVDVPM